MQNSIHYFLFIALLIFSCSFSSQKIEAAQTQGYTTYSFEGGNILCQSEVDASGHIHVMLKSLNKNTSVSFSKLDYLKNKDLFLLTAVMTIEEEEPICASWKTLQTVSIEIDPLPVQTSALTGKSVYSSEKITVFSES